MHSAPCTNTSSSMGLSCAMARTSARLSSRASTTREKPMAASCRTPAGLCTLIWVEPCSKSPGAIRRARAAAARSCTISASAPASAAARTQSAAAASSPGHRVVFTATYTFTFRAWQKAVAPASSSGVKLPAVRRALNCFKPR